MSNISRRDFLIASAGATALASTAVRASPASDVPWASEKIVDCHFHGRATDEGIIAHLDGAGITSALVLAGEEFSARMAGINAKYGRRISGWAQSSRTRPDSVAAADTSTPDPLKAFPATSSSETAAILRKAIQAGANGFAETVGRVPVDGPELQRLYALAAELDVPIMMHFQEAGVPGQPLYGITAFSRIESMLKKYPKTRFVCHASDFWGHIDAKYQDGGQYPMGKVHRGGLSDRLLADYPNIYGDLGAPSGLIQLGRDLEFTGDFVTRHQDKLLFGSDCGCLDGKGAVPAGTTLPPPIKQDASPADASKSQAPSAPSPSSAAAMQLRMAALGGLAGKCIARELLRVTWDTTPREVFRKVVWANAHRVYKLEA